MSSCPVYWQTYATEIVKTSLEQGDWASNPEATTAAIALINDWEYHHPSWVNTQFAIAAFFLHRQSDKLRRLAYCMVTNGLGGYWQWESHNPTKFSVVNALIHLGIVTAEESGNLDQFKVCGPDSGCGYLIISPKLLTRLVHHFDLPIGKLETETERFCLPSENRMEERERMKAYCLPIIGGIDDSLREEYRVAFRQM